MKNWSNYQSKTYNDDVCNLLVEFLDTYSVTDAIDLGCGSGNESVYMIKNGIKVLSVDRQLNEKYILDRLTDEEKQQTSFMECSFEDIVLPKTDLVTAFLVSHFVVQKNLIYYGRKFMIQLEKMVFLSDNYLAIEMLGTM